MADKRRDYQPLGRVGVDRPARQQHGRLAGAHGGHPGRGRPHAGTGFNSSSRWVRPMSDAATWQLQPEINIGEVVGWIFNNEDKGERMR